MVQNIYLSNYELQDALKLFFEKLNPLAIKTEIISTQEASGRVTAHAVFAKISSPHYNASAMDGIATLSSKTVGASESNHIELIEGTDYIVVDTGDAIPDGYDCVIMIEDLIQLGENKVSIYRAAIPWQNIRPLGEDIVETEMIVPAKHSIRPVDIGALIAGGINQIEVFKKPKVGIIPTGTELVEPGEDLQAGDIIDFNSRVFSAQVHAWGGLPQRYTIIKDDYNAILDMVHIASEECDIVLINAGSSAGREDYTSKVIAELGEVFVHGVAIKPGKPVILGQINGKPVVGIPGYPVSAFFIMEIFIKRLIYAFQGMTYPEEITAQAVLSRRVMSSLKYHEFVRVKLGFVDKKLIATPLNRGAGATMSLVKADGVLEIPQSIEGLEAGSEVEIKLLKSLSEIKNTLVCIGSHDPILDIASDLLHQEHNIYSLASAHVGSMGGIMALKNTETHFAPIHLLDMENGEYNLTYLKKYLPDKKIVLIRCVKRAQGFLVPKGNPLNLRGFEDLINSDVKFINRQRGSGTRLLLDYNLKKLQLSPQKINGYTREVFTHQAVAAEVAAGKADTGLAIYSVAKLFNLDFIPVSSEEYDIALPLEYLELPMVQAFIDILKSNAFAVELEKMGGYKFPEIGKVIQL